MKRRIISLLMAALLLLPISAAVAAGTPVTITSEEVREALTDSVSTIVDAIRSTLETTPPELAADIITNGITLTGGGALLRGLDELIHRETGMPVHIAENPLDCVVNGTGKCLDTGVTSNFRTNR